MNARITLISLLFALLGAGCGPISAHSAIARAHIALEAAKGAQADQFAIYEFRSAALYLEKAKEEEGYSSFQEAVNFAIKSRGFADSARARARQNKQAKPRTFEEIRRERSAPQGQQPQMQQPQMQPSMPSTPAQ